MSNVDLIQLPEDVRQRARLRTSTAIDLEFDSRTHERISALAEGHLRVTQSLDVLQPMNVQSHDRMNNGVMMKDISRSGIGFYFHKQLFPHEMIEVEFQSRLINAMVVRCKYIGPNCYEIGCKVLAVVGVGK